MIPSKCFISDNIKLSTIHTTKFKSESLTVSLSIPTTKRRYVLGLVLSGMMRRGCKGFPTMAHINRRLDDLYASSLDVHSSTYAGSLSLVFSADFINGAFALDGEDIIGGVIEVIANLLLYPNMPDGVFPEDIVKSEIALVKDALLAEKNNTRSYASTRCREIMNRNSESFPTLEYLLSTIDTVTPDELTEYYRSLLRCAPLSVFYIGRESEKSLSEKILTHFGDYVGKDTFTVKKREPSKPCEFLAVTEDMPVSQGKLVLGMRTGANITFDTHATAIVLNEILGASPASKLFLNVRERLGLCYYCNSSYSLTSGNLTVSSGIDVKNKDRAIKEILSQIEDLKNGVISDTEMDAAKKSLAYNYVQIYDAPFSLNTFYAARDTLGIHETVEECKEKLMSVTKDDVCALAKNIVYDTCYFINGTSTEAADGEEAE